LTLKSAFFAVSNMTGPFSNCYITHNTLNKILLRCATLGHNVNLVLQINTSYFRYEQKTSTENTNFKLAL